MSAVSSVLRSEQNRDQMRAASTDTSPSPQRPSDGPLRLNQVPAWASDPAYQTVQPILAPVGQGSPLNPTIRTIAERDFSCDFSSVRVHDDAGSQAAVSGIGADAATHGTNVFFASPRPSFAAPTDQRLLWHELAHVAQAPSSHNDTPGFASRLLSSPSDDHEVQADRVSPGMRVASTPTDHSGPLIHRGTRRAVSSADIDGVRIAMDSDPVGGNLAALNLLKQYEADDTVDMLIELDGEHRVERIAGAITMGDNDPVVGVIAAVLYLSPNQRPTPSWGILAAFVVGRIPEAQRMPLLEHVLRASGRGAQIATLREGTAAFDQSELDRAAEPVHEVDSAAAAAAPPVLNGVTPGPWNPPGRQPIPFYLGTSAHIAIAAAYRAVHPTDAAYYNVTAISTIIAAAGRIAGVTLGANTATASQLAMEPDIANITRLHLYEIKPTTLQSLGRSEAALYVAAFLAAGLPMSLGSTGEPGTAGVVPAPGGWYEFSAPEPGVITYRYRQPPRVRVRVPVEEPETSRVDNRSLRERISEVTGLTGAALTVYLIISEGSRLFPPRNLVPVP